MADNQHAKLLRAFLDEVCDCAARTRMVSWADWMRRSANVAAALGLSATLAACSGSSTTVDDTGGGGEAGKFAASSGGATGSGGSQAGGTGGTSSGGAGVVYGIPLEDCDNNLDDDFDGQTDCADDDCYGFAPCMSMAEYAAPMDYFERYCDDEVDNDSDGLTDCEDPDCIENGYCGGHPMSGPPAQEQNCTDGVDNDQDGATDCLDADCMNHLNCMVARYGIPF